MREAAYFLRGGYMAEPYCLAMVLCDACHRDPSTSKFTILGTFDSIISSSFPTQTSLCIYFAITDGVGSCTLRIQLVDARAGTIDAQDETPTPGRIFRIKTVQEFEDPLVVFEESVGVEFAIPEPGAYLCELWANDAMLMQRRFLAIQAGE